MGTFIFISIFFAIIIALIIVAVVGSRKDAIEKLIENDKKRKVKTQASKDRVSLFSSLDKIITDVEKEVSEFQPSIGTRSLGDINKDAIALIKKINSSESLSKIYLSVDYRNEIKPIMEELAKVKPSNWSKEATFATSLVKAKFDAVSKDKNNKEEIEVGRKLEWK